jgi:Amt family ammonium transporter
LAVGAAVAVVAGVVLAAPAVAQEATPPPTAEEVSADLTSFMQSVNLLWILIGAILVIFMQAGFALVETGFCRAKHAAHVVSTNFAIFGIGFVAFFLLGYGLMFGGYSYVLPGLGATTYDWGYSEPVGDALIGSGDWVFLWNPTKLIALNEVFSMNMVTDAAYMGAIMGFFLYMVAFMDTTATIPTGSMAERWKWNAFVGWGFFCGAIFYPIFGGWTWGGGWLAKLGSSMDWGGGYVDFAGSGIVHAMGGVAAVAGAIVLGPRIGKFGPDGKPRALIGHNIPMAMLGTFILLFGWFGFNAASTFAASDTQFAVVATNTAIAGAFGAVAGMFWITKRTGKPDPGMMANGMLAGLVGITAPCAFVEPWAAAVIGIICGVVVIESVFLVERRFKLDDPVGAISVHGVCGTLGVLFVGIFANGEYGAAWNGSDIAGVKGLLYGDTTQILAQLAGVVVLWTVMFGIAYGFFKLQNTMVKGGIRSKAEDEIAGLDIPEMGVPAYHDELSDGMGGISNAGDKVGAPV